LVERRELRPLRVVRLSHRYPSSIPRRGRARRRARVADRPDDARRFCRCQPALFYDSRAIVACHELHRDEFDVGVRSQVEDANDVPVRDLPRQEQLLLEPAQALRIPRQLRPDHPADSYSELTVDCDRLDNIVPKDRRITFIKIDVEGAELSVLRGLAALLGREMRE